MMNARRRSLGCPRIGQASDDGSSGCDWTCGLTTPLSDDNTAPGAPCAWCPDQGAPTLDLDDTVSGLLDDLDDTVSGLDDTVSGLRDDLDDTVSGLLAPLVPDTSTLLIVGAIAVGALVLVAGVAFAVDTLPAYAAAYAAARGAKAGTAG